METVIRDYEEQMARAKEQKRIAKASKPAGIFRRTYNAFRALLPETIGNNILRGGRVMVRPEDLERKK